MFHPFFLFLLTLLPVSGLCNFIQNNLINAEEIIFFMRFNACFLASFDQTYSLRQSLKFNKFIFTVRKGAETEEVLQDRCASFNYSLSFHYADFLCFGRYKGYEITWSIKLADII